MNNKTEKKKRKFLSDEEKMEIIKLHHLEGVSQCELARRYDTRQPVVSRIISKSAAENDKSALLMKKTHNRQFIRGDKGSLEGSPGAQKEAL